MRLQRIASLGLFVSLLLSSIGCNCGERRRATRPPDPLYRDVGGQPIAPPTYPPYAPDPHYIPGPPVTGSPGSPEILTPQQYPTPAIPNPPTKSGYGAYPNDIRPAEGAEMMPTPGRTIEPPFNGHSTAEPPLAPKTPANPPAKQPTQLPPDLTEPKPVDKTPPAKEPEKIPQLPPMKEADKAPLLPPAKDAEPSSLPVGIPSFAVPMARVAVGMRPTTEGLDWLQASKYRTVVYLRRKGTEDSADREQIEKRGMKYVSFEVSPESLNREMIDEFDKLVDNPANYPLFVYDKDRLLTGVMWYMHYRLVDKMSDGEAHAKAELLGLKSKDGDETTNYWLRIEAILADKP